MSGLLDQIARRRRATASKRLGPQPTNGSQGQVTPPTPAGSAASPPAHGGAAPPPANGSGPLAWLPATDLEIPPAEEKPWAWQTAAPAQDEAESDDLEPEYEEPEPEFAPAPQVQSPDDPVVGQPNAAASLTQGEWDEIVWHRVGREEPLPAPQAEPEREIEQPVATVVAEPVAEPAPEPVVEEAVEPEPAPEPVVETAAPEPVVETVAPEPAAPEPIAPPIRARSPSRSRTTPGHVERGRMRRRVRYLRALREIQLRDIGGLALELYRFGKHRPDLLEAKIAGAAVTDTELRTLERVLDEGSSIRELREAGIGGACDNCGAVHGSTDRFCSTCGSSLDFSRYDDEHPADDE
ncbi:MAG: hypothetical protein ACYDHH_26660 [Solirubrobacteraceae bacterium]